MSDKFTRLVLQNWRNFTKVDVALGERCFIVGPNAAGKSNLIDALRFLRDIAADGGNLSTAVSERGGLAALRSLHARKNPKVGIEVDTEIQGQCWTYTLVLESAGKGRTPQVAEERVTCDGKSLLQRPNAADAGDAESLGATALEQLSENKKFRVLRDFLRSVDYIHVVPQLVRQPAVGDSARFGKGLGTALIESIGEVPEKKRTARLKRISKGLASVLPQFDGIEWLQDKNGQPHLRAKYQHWRPQGGWQDESAFSDGTLRLIGLLWFLSEKGGPLLLEEPELSLHAAAVRLIPGLVSELPSSRQVFMTTHSLELLADEGIEPSEVLILDPSGDATSVKSGDNVPQLVAAAKAGLPLGPQLEAMTRPQDLLAFANFGSAR